MINSEEDAIEFWRAQLDYEGISVLPCRTIVRFRQHRAERLEIIARYDSTGSFRIMETIWLLDDCRVEKEYLFKLIGLIKDE